MIVKSCSRCSGTTKGGNRCSRSTCKYFEYCWQHTRSIKGLTLKPSGLSGGGVGLFTLKDLKKNDTVANYTGKLMPKPDWIKNKSDYAVQISKDYVINARNTQTALGRYANDCKPADRKANKCSGNNARITVSPVKKTAYLKAIKNIKAGSEIFVSYGKSFWKDK